LTANNFVAISDQWKSWCTARNLCFSKRFKRNCTVSAGIPISGVWYTKRSNWTFSVKRNFWPIIVCQQLLWFSE